MIRLTAFRILVAVALCFGIVTGAGVALATNPVYVSSTYNSCSYGNGYSGTYYGYHSHTETSSSCADLLYVSGWFFSGSTLIVKCHPFMYQWQTTSPVPCDTYGGSINNVYGYHQIQEPSGYQSPTIESHAQ